MASLIVHTEASDGWGGQELRIAKEMCYMKERGYRVALAAPKQSSIYKKMSQKGFECWAVPFSKMTRVTDFFRLVGIFMREKPLMVGTHSSGDSWSALMAAKFTGVPVRIRYRHISVPVKNNFTTRLVYGLADAVVTTGDCIAKCLLPLKIPSSKIHMISTGIMPPAHVPEAEAARRNLQNELGLPPDARFIGTTAVLRSWKGHDFLMDGFDRIADRWPNLHLVIVGAGPAEQFLKGHAAHLVSRSRIHLIGHRDNYYDYIRAFDCDLLTSKKHEGIPQSLLDAMFMGVPVIGTDVGGIPEIVRDGETGILIPPLDPGAVASAIERVLLDPASAQEKASNALKMVSENNTIPVMGKKIEDLIASILASKSHKPPARAKQQ